MSIQYHIEDILRKALTPIHIEVLNESHMHHVPPGSESHFKVIIVSEKFSGKKLLERHRLVNELFAADLRDKKFHALALTADTPEEWEKRGGKIHASPLCPKA